MHTWGAGASIYRGYLYVYTGVYSCTFRPLVEVGCLFSKVSLLDLGFTDSARMESVSFRNMCVLCSVQWLETASGLKSQTHTTPLVLLTGSWRLKLGS